VAVIGFEIEASEYMVCASAGVRFSRFAHPNPCSQRICRLWPLPRPAMQRGVAEAWLVSTHEPTQIDPLRKRGDYL